VEVVLAGEGEEEEADILKGEAAAIPIA